jgi:hypothetical protein
MSIFTILQLRPIEQHVQALCKWICEHNMTVNDLGGWVTRPMCSSWLQLSVCCWIVLTYCKRCMHAIPVLRHSMLQPSASENILHHNVICRHVAHIQHILLLLPPHSCHMLWP